jgi:uncharacterized protein (TIGR02757 family)
MSELGTFLDQLQSRYHERKFLNSDPLEFVHRYTDPWDQEAVALLAAVLAYGNVKQIRRSVEDALGRMARVSSGPADYVSRLSDPSWEAGQHAFHGFVHRFNRGSDLVVLFRLLGRSWAEYGSLGAQFVAGLAPDDEDIGPALDNLITSWRSWLGDERKVSDSFSYLLTAPKDGSCCKRWCMFLRWVGRKDSLDPGLWTETGALAHTFPPGRFVRPSQLVLPLDTHTGRISQYLRLTQRKSLNWLAAVEVTRTLRKAAPQDPTKYDFALARLGILDLCKKEYRAEICERCELLPACHYAQAKRRRPKRRS